MQNLLAIKYLYFILTLAIFLQPFAGVANPKADSLFAKATAAFDKGEFAQTLNYALQGLKLSENGTCGEKALGNMKVARAYYHLQQREMSIQYFRQTIALARDCHIDSFLRICYRQIGAVYFELGKKDSSKHYLLLAEPMLLKTSHWGEISSLYAIIGELYMSKTSGKDYFDLALKYAVKSGSTESIAFATMKQGLYATFHKDCMAGQKYFDKAFSLYQSIPLVEGEMYAMQAKGWALNECGKSAEAYKLMKALLAKRDSVFKKETAEKAANFRTLYETEKKERENAVLAKQNTLKELEIAQEVKNKRLLLAGFSILILVLLIAFLFIYSKYKLKKQKELDQQLAQQQEKSFAAVIEAEEKERKRIAIDLHDGIGQTMSAAKINLSVLQNDIPFTSDEQRSTFEKIVALVDESCREVRSVSHSMMPNALLKSGLATAIRNFIGQIDTKVLSVDFYSEGLDTSINTNNEVVLYRVMQECVNNVIKHARASRLYISLIKDEEGISVTIEDNGKGFDASNAGNFEGIGLKNIQSRIGYLKGTVEWDSSPGKGTVVTINIPA